MAKPSVLYVDDETNNLNAFRATFRREYEVVTALSAEEALGLLENRSFHVIISDERMPGTTGSAFFKQVYERFPKPIRMLMTGYADMDAVIRAINEGKIYRYITKPWEENDLRLTIDQAVRFFDTQQDLHHRNIELQEANEELERFVYSASHDMRAPLASILGITQLAQMEIKEPLALEYMEKIQQSVGRLDEFIRNMINYYRSVHTVDSLSQQLIDWDSFIRKRIQQLEFFDKAPSVQFQLSIQQEGDFKNDSTRLQIILNNLISNAIIYQRDEERHKRVTIQVESNAQEAQITIEDNGVGIESEQLDEVFKLFKRSVPQGKGSGIGLFIVQETMRKLSGNLHVESTLGKGTIFKIRIPNLIESA